MLVIFGVGEDSFETIDGCKIRNGADMAAIDGLKNCHVIAAATEILYRFENRQFLTRIPSNIMRRKLYARHPGLQDSAAFCENNYRRGRRAMILSTSILTFFHYALSKKDRVIAEQFLNGLVFGEGLRKSSPIYVMRERLMTNALAKAKMTRPELLSLIVKSWNAFVQGKTIKNLRWSRSESFPVIASIPKERLAKSA